MDDAHGLYEGFKRFIIDLLLPFVPQMGPEASAWLTLIQGSLNGSCTPVEMENAVKAAGRYLAIRDEAMFNKVRTKQAAFVYIMLYGLHPRNAAWRPEVEDLDLTLTDVCEKYIEFVGQESTLIQPLRQRFSEV